MLGWLRGNPFRPSDEQTWPVSEDASEAAWQHALAQLRGGQEELQSEVARLDDARLDEPILPGMPTVYTTLHGLVHHHLYHAGQISLLKKING